VSENSLHMELNVRFTFLASDAFVYLFMFVRNWLYGSTSTLYCQYPLLYDAGKFHDL